MLKPERLIVRFNITIFLILLIHIVNLEHLFAESNIITVYYDKEIGGRSI